MCRTLNVGADRIAYLGRTIRAPRTALGIASLPVARLPKPLQCREAPQPNFDEHAVILGWPEGDENKSARMSLQQDIAAAADPVLPLT